MRENLTSTNGITDAEDEFDAAVLTKLYIAAANLGQLLRQASMGLGG